MDSSVTVESKHHESGFPLVLEGYRLSHGILTVFRCSPMILDLTLNTTAVTMKWSGQEMRAECIALRNFGQVRMGDVTPTQG